MGKRESKLEKEMEKYHFEVDVRTKSWVYPKVPTSLSRQLPALAKAATSELKKFSFNPNNYSV